MMQGHVDGGNDPRCCALSVGHVNFSPRSKTTYLIQISEEVELRRTSGTFLWE